MGKLTKTDPTARELVTEILDEARLWSTVRLIVQFLHAKNIEQVRAEFGFVLDRDLEGKQKPQTQIVELSDLESFIKRGLDEGTIEWGRSSDFYFYPLGAEVEVMLCNDADLHLSSTDFSLLLDLGRKIGSSGIKVFDSGHII